MTRQAALKPICVIYGDSALLKREALARIVARELAGGDPAMCLVRLDGEDLPAAEALDAVRTYSLLGGRRVVIVDDADDFISNHRAVLERYAASPSESGCLVLLCKSKSFDRRTRFYKAVAQIGELVECKAPSGPALRSWITQRARDVHGKRLDARAAAVLVDHAGTSQEGLDQELAKLAIYVGERPQITELDIANLVGRYREQTVFAVMDAIAQGNAAAALAEWQQVLATDRAAPGRAIGGLAWAVRRLADARRRLDEGESIYALARLLWTDPDTCSRRMERTTVRRCEDQLSDLLEADLDSKTGGATVNTAIEKFIIKHSLMAARA